MKVTPDHAGTRLEVADSGPGIAPADRERVFDRFYRGTAAHADGAARGSGLGLAIVKRIVERHHGRIALASGIGGGGLNVIVSFAVPIP